MNDIIMLHAACSIYGHSIRTYDNAGSDMFLFRDAGGMSGLVKADSREKAYEIVEDEILQPIPEEDVLEAYGVDIQDSRTVENWTQGPLAPFYVVVENEEHETRLGPYPTHGDALRAAETFVINNEMGLTEGYSYQSNATGTGIVSHNLSGEELREIDTATLHELDIIPIFETED